MNDFLLATAKPKACLAEDIDTATSQGWRRYVLALSGLVIAGTITGGAWAQQSPPSEPVVIKGASASAPITPEVFDGDLRDLPKARRWRQGDPVREVPRQTYPERQGEDPARQPTSREPDPLLELQESFSPDDEDRVFTTPDLNFEGISFTGVFPPDTVGDVGPNHYIQMVNSAGGSDVVIYDKSGVILVGPFTLDRLLPTGTCGVGGGDPIVLYDRLADRWLLSEFASRNIANALCVYISQTPDPVTGGWVRYTFPTPNFPDYPKYAVWPDAYYVSTNESSPAVYAMDRAAMLVGASTAFQRFTAPSLAGFPFQALIPGDLDGAMPPPAGSPAYFMRHRDDEVHNISPDPTADFLEVWELDVDFVTPANSTFTNPLNIAVSEFDSDLCGLVSFFCFPQPGTSTTLDPLREVVMWRLQYRNFGSHETLVGNLVTDVNGLDHGGIRWFELRKAGPSAWSLFQEGTHSPDGADRWMGSIAMDRDGNIALGYSVSSSSVFPSMRYTGRQAGDPPGVMTQPETSIIAGTGSQTFTTRWGDYSAMSVDPSNDCTFWHTNEYIPTSGNWRTRVATFEFASCGQAPQVIVVDQARVNQNFKRVSLPVSFQDPVVIAGPPTFRGRQPGVVRLSSVTSGSFRLRFQEWDYLDGSHAQEDIPYLVINEGRQVMADGSIWEAGTFPLSGTGNFQGESFTQPFPAAPALFLTIQTSSGGSAVTARARQVSASGFQAALFEQQSLMGSGHATEQVGYLAIHSSRGSGRVPVTGGTAPYLLQSVSLDERFVPVLSSTLKLEEEQSQDNEVGHGFETVSVLALGQQIFAQQVTNTGPDPAAIRRLAPAFAAPVEWGTVDGVTDDRTTVPLFRSYTNPVVVARPVSTNGGDPGVIRLSGVTGNSFELRYQEWRYLDGNHGARERMFYMVAESGTHSLGSLAVEAARLDTNRLVPATETVGFTTPFPGDPVVLSSVMTSRGADTVTTRVRNVSGTGFRIAMQEEEASTGGHGTETLGWIAIEQGNTTTSDNRDIRAFVTGVNSTSAAVPFGATFGRLFPVVAADINTIRGRDPVFLRFRDLTPSSVELFLDEEASLDPETSHGVEDVGVFAAE